MTHTLLSLVLLVSSASAHALPRIHLIDAHTGQWLEGEVEVQALEKTGPGQSPPALLTVASNQALTFDLPTGHYRITALAESYKPLQTEIRLGEQRIQQLWFELPAQASNTIASQKTAHPNSIAGQLTQAEDGQPLGGALVRFDLHDLSTTSDSDGYFELTMPAQASDQDLSLIVSSEGRTSRLTFEVAPLPGVRLRLALPEGHSQQIQPAPMAWSDEPPTHWPGPWEAAKTDRADTGAESKASITQQGRPILPAAASIRMGDDCSGRNCNVVRVMALEDYVAGGLPDEWIASWHINALRAGAVAYRSYAAWHIANPISSAYDICNSTSCQVWSPSRHPRTDQAVADTAGILLNLPGQSHAFRAEYAAENNNLLGNDRPCSNLFRTCGDGSVGSPGADWPCLDDSPVATGRSCFGHGRGMSQWGTQGWALLQRSWPDIVNHYYNASGDGAQLRRAVMTRPFETGALSLSQNRIGPGSRIKIQWPTSLDQNNWPLNALMGASLRCGGGWIDDGDNDSAVVIQPGDGRVARAFRLNQAVSGAQCDVMVALYADGNDNVRIDSNDLLLVRRTETAVISVDTDQLFRDEFRR